MELNDMKGGATKKGFFQSVFNFDEDSKEEMLNIVQYAVLALIPIIILNKSIQRFVPEADDEKGNVEILAEIVIQIVSMFLGLFFIHRIVSYIPTYSGTKYPDFHVTTIVLSVLMVVLSLQTKLGEKVSILVERISELWNGEKDNENKNKKPQKGSPVKVSQPINQGQMPPLSNQQTTSLSMLPPPQLMGEKQSQQPMDYSSPAPSTSLYEGFEPMAANECGGGGFGGANW